MVANNFAVAALNSLRDWQPHIIKYLTIISSSSVKKWNYMRFRRPSKSEFTQALWLQYSEQTKQKVAKVAIKHVILKRIFVTMVYFIDM